MNLFGRRLSRLSRPAWYLLATHFIVFIALSSSNVFVSAYIYQLSGDVRLLGLFFIALFLSWSVALLTIAPQCKGGQTVISLRIGLAFFLLYYLLLSILQERVADVIIFVGIIRGTGEAFYWLSSNLLSYEFNTPYERQEFFALFSIVLHLAQLVAPISIGAVIWWTGSYVTAFVVLTVLFAFAFRFSLMIEKVHAIADLPAFDSTPILRAIRQPTEIRRSLIANLLIGFSIWGAMTPMMYALMHRVTQNEIVLGEIASVLPLLGLGVAYFVKRSNNKQMRTTAIIAGMALFLNSLFLFLPITQLSLVVYAIFQIAAGSALTVLCNLYTFNAIDHYSELRNYRTEYLAWREYFLNFGRCASFIVCVLIFYLGSSDLLYGLSYLAYGTIALGGALIFSRMSNSNSQTVTQAEAE